MTETEAELPDWLARLIQAEDAGRRARVHVQQADGVEEMTPRQFLEWTRSLPQAPADLLDLLEEEYRSALIAGAEPFDLSRVYMEQARMFGRHRDPATDTKEGRQEAERREARVKKILTDQAWPLLPHTELSHEEFRVEAGRVRDALAGRPKPTSA